MHGAARLRIAFLASLAALACSLVAVSPAEAGPGYELDASTPSRSLNGYFPHGIAVDQANHRIYVAITTKNGFSGTPGEIERFESDLSAAGTFSSGSAPFYSGIAVNPVTQGFYAAQTLLHTPLGDLGTAKMDPFSSTGVAGTSFALSDTGTLPQIATDSSGDVYYPNAATHSVQVFNSAGVLQEEIGCAGCTGGAFGKPVSVALDSDDNLYVADLSPDRVVKLTSSGGPYAFASLLQSGRGAAAVGVDPSSDDVLVGDLPNGRRYHVVAYNSAGVQFDDFGAGLFTDPEPAFGPILAAQIAADATSHRLYIGDAGKFYVFDRVASSKLPTAAIKPPSKVGQLVATINANANVNGHAALSCEFEYTDDADFQLNEFANADTAACPQMPDGTNSVTLEKKLSGLAPATLFHYRLKVASNAGAATSGGETFTTLPVVPLTITAESALPVTESGATLNAKLNPHGGTVSNCHFEYGPTAAYGTNVSCTKLPEAVTTDVAESRAIAGLTPGATYHYRLVATSNAGTVNGGDVAFTTAVPSQAAGDSGSSSPAPNNPSTPPPTVTPPKPKPLTCRKGFRKKKVQGKVRCVRHRHAHRKRRNN